jgi:hypothetical protein
VNNSMMMDKHSDLVQSAMKTTNKWINSQPPI